MVPGLWFKNDKRDQDVQIGSVFRHRISGDIVETARVRDVVEDALGITHVTYDVLVEKPNWGTYYERRTLGLESFNQRFEEAI